MKHVPKDCIDSFEQLLTVLKRSGQQGRIRKPADPVSVLLDKRRATPVYYIGIAGLTFGQEAPPEDWGDGRPVLSTVVDTGVETKDLVQTPDGNGWRLV